MSKHSVLIQWSENDQAFIAMVPELEGLSAFGKTPEEAVKELGVAKKLFLEVLEADGEEIPEPEVLKPFSGQTRLRIPKSLHAALAIEAKKEGLSLNTYLVQLLSEKNVLNQIRKEIEEIREEIKSLKSKVSESRISATSGISFYNPLAVTTAVIESTARPPLAAAGSDEEFLPSYLHKPHLSLIATKQLKT